MANLPLPSENDLSKQLHFAARPLPPQCTRLLARDVLHLLDLRSLLSHPPRNVTKSSPTPPTGKRTSPSAKSRTQDSTLHPAPPLPDTTPRISVRLPHARQPGTTLQRHCTRRRHGTSPIYRVGSRRTGSRSSDLTLALESSRLRSVPLLTLQSR